MFHVANSSKRLDLLASSNIARYSCQLLTLSNRKRFPPRVATSDHADTQTSGNYAFARTYLPLSLL